MIVLDTHAWLWCVTEDPKLSVPAQRIIDTTDRIGVCAISCWEVAMLIEKGRIGFSLDVEAWIHLAFRRPGIRLLPLEPAIAVLSTRLPGNFHGDPADRMIVATCLQHGARLVTKDQQITKWGQVPVVW